PVPLILLAYLCSDDLSAWGGVEQPFPAEASVVPLDPLEQQGLLPRIDVPPALTAPLALAERDPLRPSALAAHLALVHRCQFESCHRRYQGLGSSPFR